MAEESHPVHRGSELVRITAPKSGSHACRLRWDNQDAKRKEDRKVVSAIALQTLGACDMPETRVPGAWAGGGVALRYEQEEGHPPGTSENGQVGGAADQSLGRRQEQAFKEMGV